MTKKTPININKGALAAGFFSSETIEKVEKEENHEKDDVTLNPPAHKGGRPKKEGLKAEQFSLTMEPEKYEKLRIIAKKYAKGNFSNLIDQTITVFCNANHIDLDTIKVDPDILKHYIDKQQGKKKKNK